MNEINVRNLFPTIALKQGLVSLTHFLKSEWLLMILNIWFLQNVKMRKNLEAAPTRFLILGLLDPTTSRARWESSSSSWLATPGLFLTSVIHGVTDRALSAVTIIQSSASGKPGLRCKYRCCCKVDPNSKQWMFPATGRRWTQAAQSGCQGKAWCWALWCPQDLDLWPFG